MRLRGWLRLHRAVCTFSRFLIRAAHWPANGPVEDALTIRMRIAAGRATLNHREGTQCKLTGSLNAWLTSLRDCHRSSNFQQVLVCAPAPSLDVGARNRNRENPRVSLLSAGQRPHRNGTCGRLRSAIQHCCTKARMRYARGSSTGG